MQGSKIAFYLYRLSAKGVISIIQTSCSHTVTDQDHTLRTKHGKGCADHRRMDMYTVADQLCMACFRIPNRTDHARISMIQWWHCIVQMGCMGSTTLNSFFCSIIIRCGMRKGYNHLILCFLDKFHGSRFFRYKIHQFDQSLCRLLKPAEIFIITMQDIFFCLGTFFGSTDKWSFHIDTDQVCTAIVGVITCIFHDI